MNDIVNKYLYDILTCIDAVSGYFGDKKIFKEYTQNRERKRAVERELEIIGEAMSKILKIEPNINVLNAPANSKPTE